MAKIARVLFLGAHFFNHTFSIELFEDVLDELPIDTKIVGMGTDSATAEGFLKVWSDDFKDTPPLGKIPEIFIDLQIDPVTSKYYVANVDMSAALATTSSNNSCGCGKCYHCVMGITPPHLQVNLSPSQAVAPAPGNFVFSPDDFLGIRAGFCNHEWKIYDSGFSRDEYCTKCPEKRKI